MTRFDMSCASISVGRAEATWPPTYPRVPSLLIPNDDPTTPRESWSADEWMAYARFLEESGSRLNNRLLRCQKELAETRAKLTRNKGGKTFPFWLGDPSPLNKRGRKQSGLTKTIAIGALEIWSEFASEGRTITYRKALEKYYERNHMPKYRAVGKAAGHMLNLISELRRRQINSES